MRSRHCSDGKSAVRSNLVRRCLAGAIGLLVIAGCQNTSTRGADTGSGATKAVSQVKPLYSGYLCCNLRTNGSWISDINYHDAGTKVIAAGTPVKVVGYGSNRVELEVDGQSKNQFLGNDYSRSVDITTFIKRFVVGDDPRAKMNGFAPNVQAAIKAGRLMPGMTQEQVVMSVGWPVADENPNLEAEIWRHWLSSFGEFQVVFDDQRVVREVLADRLVESRILHKAR